ncbi:MAG: hypothetical protein BWY04_00929 [candidate division CPR1 bacterium ADurb.Bin160]|uniref:Uncharacterized protein n=1 Tax=candidate division CPR1 bacterium ADurb.Bin160 TaxID=1852826 RepID=A0A1V5ZLW0_9BACT|nr:MAG: hypothetical protein BWY04_00929 [candidate division CPR1 bacterium ADurb.Bin160]
MRLQSVNLILIAHSSILIPHSNLQSPVAQTSHFLALFRTLKSSKLSNLASFLLCTNKNGCSLCKNMFDTLSHSCKSMALTHPAVFHIALISEAGNSNPRHCSVTIATLSPSETAKTAAIFSFASNFITIVGNFLNFKIKSLFIFLILLSFVRNNRCS